MRRIALLILLAWPVIAGDAVYELPANPKTPVLTLDYRGGFGPPRKSDEPRIAILADGTLKAEHVKAGTKLAPAELQKLLRFVIDTHKMMAFDRKAVSAKARGEVYITDQPDTILTIAIKGKKHTARFYGSTWAAQQFPKVKELQSLEAVRKRLHTIRCTAQLGAAQAKKLLALANAELKKRHPAVAPWTMDDLERVFPQPNNGSRRVQFIRWHAKGAEGAYVTLPAKGPPTVDVFVQAR